MGWLRRAASLLSLVLLATGLAWSSTGGTAVTVAHKPPRGRVADSSRVPASAVVGAVTDISPSASVGVEV